MNLTVDGCVRHRTADLCGRLHAIGVRIRSSSTRRTVSRLNFSVNLRRRRRGVEDFGVAGMRTSHPPLGKCPRNRIKLNMEFQHPDVRPQPRRLRIALAATGRDPMLSNWVIASPTSIIEGGPSVEGHANPNSRVPSRCNVTRTVLSMMLICTR
jgi:hypothetical protein